MYSSTVVHLIRNRPIDLQLIYLNALKKSLICSADLLPKNCKIIFQPYCSLCWCDIIFVKKIIFRRRNFCTHTLFSSIIQLILLTTQIKRWMFIKYCKNLHTSWDQHVCYHFLAKGWQLGHLCCCKSLFSWSASKSMVANRWHAYKQSRYI